MKRCSPVGSGWPQSAAASSESAGETLSSRGASAGTEIARSRSGRATLGTETGTGSCRCQRMAGHSRGERWGCGRADEL